MKLENPCPGSGEYPAKNRLGAHSKADGDGDGLCKVCGGWFDSDKTKRLKTHAPKEASAPEASAPEPTWPDIDAAAEEAIRNAFSILNQAPGQRTVYAQVQQKLAEAIRILKEGAGAGTGSVFDADR